MRRKLLRSGRIKSATALQPALPREAIGTFTHIPEENGPRRNIRVLNALPPAARDRVVGHELGHAIEDLAGEIPMRGLDRDERRYARRLICKRA